MNVLLNPFFHRGCENIGIFFDKEAQLDNRVRKIKGIKWSQTNKCWYLPFNEASYKAIKEAVKPVAGIDQRLLKQYLVKKKRIAKTAVATSKTHIAAKAIRISKIFLAILILKPQNAIYMSVKNNW